VRCRPLRRVLIANRGEIAVRIVRACFEHGLTSVLAHSEADGDSLAAQLADETICIGPAPATSSYLNVEAVIASALVMKCDALHPGYGFLSERAVLARACQEAGVTFIGPSADAISRGGDKSMARELARSVGIPVAAGTTATDKAAEAARLAESIGFPVLLKAAAGGGGRGMVLIGSPDGFTDTFERASEEARIAFGDGRLYVERFVANARHIEVQILADAHGNVIHLFDRDCSAQRRYQKLVEEAPASFVPEEIRQVLAQHSVDLARALDYVGAATVEFLFDADRDTYFFLEINTRIQVEHPVTEAVTGIDIVREQLRIANNDPLSVRQEDVAVIGHALECRVNAEDPRHEFRPAPGLVTNWVHPTGNGIRVDSHCFPGYRIPPDYDSLLAKFICTGTDRAEAIDLMARTLTRLRAGDIHTTANFAAALVSDADFKTGAINTRWVEEKFLPSWIADHELTNA
jgi:acetyl-CoA carboxylase biotin carboxylase subunit